jgi:hypothetical protein
MYEYVCTLSVLTFFELTLNWRAELFWRELFWREPLVCFGAKLVAKTILRVLGVGVHSYVLL